MMLLRTPTPTQSLDQSAGFRAHGSRKRKAEQPPENNERLSKRLSLLNLEQNGPKLYVPVENPVSSTSSPSFYTSPPRNVPHHASLGPSDTELMQLDDTKHKVYIYNLDDELTSSESDSESADKVIFLPDIEKHLRSRNRIPGHILENPQLDRDLADKQMVLYSVPSSISVPEEQDSVRKAIIEARARLRERDGQGQVNAAPPPPVMESFEGVATPGVPPTPFPEQYGEDPDAMDLD